MLARPADRKAAPKADALADFVKTKFKISDMADAVLAGYAEAIANRRSRRRINSICSSFLVRLRTDGEISRSPI